MYMLSTLPSFMSLSFSKNEGRRVRSSIIFLKDPKMYSKTLYHRLSVAILLDFTGTWAKVSLTYPRFQSWLFLRY